MVRSALLFVSRFSSHPVRIVSADFTISGREFNSSAFKSMDLKALLLTSRFPVASSTAALSSPWFRHVRIYISPDSLEPRFFENVHRTCTIRTERAQLPVGLALKTAFLLGKVVRPGG